MLGARIYAWAGATDEAIALLEDLAFNPPAHGPAEITRDPFFTIPLATSPRYRALAQRLEAEIAANQSIFPR